MGFLSTLLSGKSDSAIEAFGTFLFVLIGTSALTAINVTGQATTALTMLVGVLAFSSVLGWLVYTFGAKHPAHFNPATTLMSWLMGKTPLKAALSFIMAQLFGAVLASILVALMYGTAGVEAKIGAPYPSTSMGVWAALIAELLGSMILLLALRYSMSHAVSNGQRATLVAMGFGMGFLMSVGISGGGLNPARSLAPQLTAADMTGWWAYLFGPVLAASVIGLISKAPVVAEQQATTKSTATPVAPTTKENVPQADNQELQQLAHEAAEELQHEEQAPAPRFAPAKPSFYQSPPQTSTEASEEELSEAPEDIIHPAPPITPSFYRMTESADTDAPDPITTPAGPAPTPESPDLPDAKPTMPPAATKSTKVKFVNFQPEEKD